MTDPSSQPGGGRSAATAGPGRVGRDGPTVSPGPGRAGRPRAARGRGPARCRSRSRPASIRDSSRSRSLGVEHGQPRAGDRAVVGLLDHDVPVGVRRDLRQVGHHQHLGVARQLGQPAARPRPPRRRRRRRRPRRRRTSAPGWCRPARPRAPASPGTARRPRRPCSAGAARSRCWRRAGTRPRRRPTGRSAATAPPPRSGLAARRRSGRRLLGLADLDLEPGVRHREQRQLRGDLVAEPRGRLRPGRGQRGRRPSPSSRAQRRRCAARSSSIRSSVSSRSSSRVAERSATRPAPRRWCRRTCG